MSSISIFYSTRTLPIRYRLSSGRMYMTVLLKFHLIFCHLIVWYSLGPMNRYKKWRREFHFQKPAHHIYISSNPHFRRLTTVPSGWCVNRKFSSDCRRLTTPFDGTNNRICLLKSVINFRSSKISLDVLPFDWLVQFKSHEQEKVHLHKPARHICISSNPHFRSSSSRFNWPWNTFINWEASWLYGFTKFSENDSSVLTECQRNFFLNQTLWV